MIKLLTWLAYAVVYLPIGTALVWWVTKMERQYRPETYADAYNRDSPIRIFGMIASVAIWPFLAFVLVLAAWQAARAEFAARKRGLPTNWDTWLGRIF